MSKSDIEVGHATVEDFAYWINERHLIHLKREAGDPYPWTEDEILLKYKFTNVFRQLDRGTIALNNLLKLIPEDDLRMRAFTCWWYRLFNLDIHANYFVERGEIPTPVEIEEYIQGKSKRGEKIFTSAHLTTSRAFSVKWMDYMEGVRLAYDQADNLVYVCKETASVLEVTRWLVQWPFIGGFVGYEIACDLLFIPGLLLNATDRLTWANMGPGARRGLRRLGLPAKNQMDGLISMRNLYNSFEFRQALGDHVRCHIPTSDGAKPAWPPFEIREIEHSLCEFDKYQRAKTGVGTPRQLFRRPADA